MPQSTKIIAWFSDLTKKDVGIAGGKGASLGEMTHAKIPVPNGFVVTSDTFERFITETDLNIELDSILDHVNHKEMQSVEDASEKIKALILNAKTPKAIEKEIMTSFKKLDAKFVAVRSSATSEDSSSAAWAGQLDSFLNTTEEHVLDKVKHCWASLFTPRAIFYRFEKGLHETKISVAVVVQKMVQSEISGIAFSVHPVTQDRNQLIIEAGYGLGEAIVSGQITPDSYVVEKVPRRIIDTNISEQERGLFKVGAQGGNEWQQISKERGALQKLSNAQILALSEIILGIEKHYKFPCDIEWAMEKNKFYIVQSRPITTLTDNAQDATMPEATKDTDAAPKAKVKKKVENEALTKENTPIQQQTNNQDILTWAENYLKTVPLDIKTARCSLFTADIVFTAYAEPSCFGETYSPLFIPYTHQKLQQIVPAERMNGIERGIWKEVLNNSKKLTRVLNDAHAIQKKIETHSLFSKKLTQLSQQQLHKYLSKLITLTHAWWAYGSIGEEKGLIVDERIIPALTKNHHLTESEAREYIIDMSTPAKMSVFSEERIAFLELCIMVMKNKQLLSHVHAQTPISEKTHSQFFKKVRAYTTTYFYSRTDFYEEQHLDEKSILPVLSQSITKSSLKDFIQEKEHIEEEILHLRKRQKTYAKKIKLTREEKALMHYFTAMHPWIDDRKVAMIKQFHYLSLTLREIERRTAIPYATLALLSPQEVLELLNGKKFDLRDITARDKNTFLIFGKEKEPLRFSGADAERLTQAIPTEKTNTTSVSGTIASKGKSGTPHITGKIRIVLNPAKDPFHDGEVLVASMTRPEFVPIMKKAIAIVTDEGGLTCHAAIVSRELGIPCIIGTKNATAIFADGDLVTIDVQKGTVTKIVKKNLKNDSKETSAEEIKSNIHSLSWEPWLARPFEAFTLSFFEDAYCTESFEAIGLKGIDPRPQLFQNNQWYLCDAQMREMDAQVGAHMQKHRMSEITFALAEFKKKSEERITELILDKRPIQARFSEFYDIMKTAATYVWLAHGLDSYYSQKLATEVPKYVKGDISKFIGDASFPTKKNANAILDELMRSNLPSVEIAKRAGWVKVRDGFSDPFTPQEIDAMRKDLAPLSTPAPVKIPSQLKKLFSEVQEAVFFRTERTDVLYYLYFIARPLLKELATAHNIPFSELRYYRARSFVFGTPEKFGKKVTFAFDGKEVLFTDEPILEHTQTHTHEVKGIIAFKGKVTGIVKVVHDINEIAKVEKGDILVAPMTVPSFIPAMNRAIAFVTDEGGLTCHAAIVARELKKPCIIGTKNATKVLTDGDVVEIDATLGTVKIISRASKN